MVLGRLRARLAPRIPKTVGLLAYLVGIANLSALFLPPFHHAMAHRLEHLPGAIVGSSVVTVVGTGLAYVLLADALSRRKRRAWLVVTTLSVAAIAVHIAYAVSREHSLGLPGLPAIAMLALLIVGRDEFDAEPDRRTAWRTMRVLAATAGATLVLGAGIVVARAEGTERPLTLGLYVRTLLYGVVGIESPLTTGPGLSADLAFYALLALGLTTAVATLASLLSSARYEGYMGDNDQARIRELLAAHGERDSLGYFALRRDKSVVWAPSGRACITYRVTLEVMLASGDPIGLQSQWPDAIAEFMKVAKHNAWIPAAAGVSQAGAQAWQNAGLSALEIGDEAVLDTATFTLEGREMRNVRHMVNRARKRGYTTDVRRAHDLEPGELELLQRYAHEWRHGGTERGYSMALGRLGEPEDDATLVVRVFDGSDVVAFNTYVPWGEHGVSLDFMRRSPACESGVNELTVAAIAEAGAALGIERVSLNFAAFRSIIDRGERIGAGAVSRFNRNVLVAVSRWVQIDSLYRFNAKFQPGWVPRYIMYPDGRSFLHVCLSFLEAEGFLPALSRRRALTKF